MTQGIERQAFYFKKKGPTNTDKALEIALSFCSEHRIRKIVVASSTGETALKCHSKIGSSTELEIVAVTYGAGSKYRAVLIRPGYAASLFDTRIKTVLCMPSG